MGTVMCYFVRRIQNEQFEVAKLDDRKSETSKYVVGRDVTFCNCPGFAHSNPHDCRHMEVVRIWLKNDCKVAIDYEDNKVYNISWILEIPEELINGVSGFDNKQDKL